jgi:hypothetical protein
MSKESEPLSYQGRSIDVILSPSGSISSYRVQGITQTFSKLEDAQRYIDDDLDNGQEVKLGPDDSGPVQGMSL